MQLFLPPVKRIGAISPTAQGIPYSIKTTMPSVQKYLRLLVYSTMLCFFQSQIYAQQDPMFTNYMFNTLSYNPAYAGSKDYLSANIVYRNQWFGWNEDRNNLNSESNGGAPISQTFTLHGPLNKRVGLGVSVVNDQIGATSSTGANFSYAYRIKFGQGALNVALQAGFQNFRADWNQLVFKDPQQLDRSFQNTNPSLWIPNFGTGVYYQDDDFYIGISVPRLLNLPLRELKQDDNRLRVAQTYQHYYVTGGAVFPIKSDDLVFKPSILIKSVELLSSFNKSGNRLRTVGAPTAVDIDVSLLMQQTFWIGLSFRAALEETLVNNSTPNDPSVTTYSLGRHDSFDLWVAFFLNNGLRIGFSYDYPVSKLQLYSAGSFEVMMGYDFNYTTDKVSSPRYF